MQNKILSILGIARKAGKIVYGETMFKLFAKSKIHYILISNDISERSLKQLIKKAEYYKINYYQILSSEMISNAIGKNNIKAVGITDVNFKKIIENIIREGGV